MRSVSFDLFTGGDRAEYNFDEALRGEGAEADAADGSAVLD
jgi:hypothetical protein